MKGLLLTLICAICEICGSPAFAAGAGTTAADSLNLGMGPRAAGMGEAFTGLADDASALYWNPSGMAKLNSPEANFTYLNLFEDVQQHYLAYVRPDPATGFAFGGSLSYLRVTPFDGYDNSAGKAGSVEAADTVLTAGIAQRWDRLAVGGTVKYLRSELDAASAQTQTVDLGVSWISRQTNRQGRLDLGAAVSNLIGGMRFDKKTDPLPRSLRLGASWSKTIVADDALTLSADLIKNDAAKGLEYAAGAEYWLVNLVALRAGWHSGQDVGTSFRAGLGLRFRSLQFDYSWAGFGDLGMVQRAAISVRFGKVLAPTALDINRLNERARRLHAQGRYLEEVMTLDKILDLDPSDADALARMKAAAAQVPEEQLPKEKAR